MAEHLELGDMVRDKITGFQGIVIARSEWLYGCIRLVVQPREVKSEGTVRYSSETFDEPQLELVEKGVIANRPPADRKHRKHGPRSEVARGSEI